MKVCRADPPKGDNPEGVVPNTLDCLILNENWSIIMETPRALVTAQWLLI
jgi:hypothetical protein